MKIILKIVLLFLLLITNLNTFANNTYTANGSGIVCGGLPGCTSSFSDGPMEIVAKISSELIQYVAVVAVLALIVAGFKYIIVGQDESKRSANLKRIIWILVAVLISISGYYILNLINNLDISV